MAYVYPAGAWSGLIQQDNRRINQRRGARTGPARMVAVRA